MYICRYRFRHTAADAADTAIFAMRNPATSGKVLFVNRIVLTVGFDGTSAVSDVGHALSRFSGANPTGGTSPLRMNTRKLSGGVASVVTDASIKEGAALTLAASFEGNFHELVIPTTTGTVLSQVLDFLEPIRLEQGEGLAVRTSVTAVIGTTASGSVWWNEEPV
jgi:hypothetical protein